MDIPHINVIILTPGPSLMGSYVKSLLELIQVLSQNEITWAWSNEYASHVADAREITLNGDNQNSFADRKPFKGKVTYDKLMWIDSDIAFTPEDVLKLYYSDKDIISGCYLLATGEATVYPKMLKMSLTVDEIKAKKELFTVEGVGFGFVCVKQGVFENLTRPWFQSSLYTFFDEDTQKEITFPIMGEDLSWCDRVRKLGYEIWVDPTIQVTHHKMFKLTWEGPRP